MGKNNIGASQSSTLDGSFGKSEKSKAKKYKIIGLVAIICVLGISINYFNKKYIYTDAIAKNIFIEGIDVSNLTKEEAINYINENITPSDIQLNYDGETNIISLDEIDLKYNTSEVVDEAYNYTKTDSYFENIKRFFDLNKNIKNLEIKSLYNENKLSEKIQSISESINVAMENAKVYISDSGNISASSATIGKELDIAATKESIYDAIKNKDYKAIDLKVNIKQPKINTEAAKSVNTLLAEFSTKFSTNDSNRVTNIVLSAKATSDVLLMPGEEFSYNNLTGKRTKSNGYKDAPVIINGKLEQEDLFTINNPGEAYLLNGGFVFFAEYCNEIVGCVALKRLDECQFEFAKLIVTEKARRLGVATKLIERCIARCKENNISNLWLQTTNKLVGAHKLYYKMGFMDKEAPLSMNVLERTEKIMMLQLNDDNL